MDLFTPVAEFLDLFMAYRNQGGREYVIFADLHFRWLPFSSACSHALSQQLAVCKCPGLQSVT